MTRPNLGHTESVLVKIHPDLRDHLEAKATANYCSLAEYIRKLIIADMRQEST